LFTRHIDSTTDSITDGYGRMTLNTVEQKYTFQAYSVAQERPK